MKVLWETLTSVSSSPWMLERPELTSLVIDLKGAVPSRTNCSHKSNPWLYLLPPPSLSPLPSRLAILQLSDEISGGGGESRDDIIKNIPLPTP